MNADNTSRVKRGTLLRRLSTPLALTIVFSLIATGTLAIKMVLAQRDLAIEPADFDLPILSGTASQDATPLKTAPVQTFAAVQDFQVYVPRTVVETVIDPEDPSKSRQQTHTVYQLETRSRGATEVNGIFSDRTASGPVDSETRGWIAALRNQPEQERDEALLQKLKQKLTEQFEKRHAAQVDRLEKISSALKRTEEILQQRDEHKTEIIERRLTELLGGRDQLDWDYTPQLPGVQLGDSRAGATLPRSSGGTSAFEVTSEVRSEEFPAPHDFQNAIALDVSNEALLSTRVATSPAGSDDRQAAYSTTAGSGTSEVTQGAFPAIADSASNDDNQGYPTTASVQANDRSTSFQAKENELALVATDDIVGIGFRWRGLLQQYERAEALFKNGAMSSTEFEQLKNALDATALQWKFKARELSSQLEAAELEVQIAEEKFNFASQLSENDVSPDSRREQLEAQKAVRIGILELETTKEKLQWVKEFEKTLSLPGGNSEEETVEEAEEETEEEPEEEAEGSTSFGSGR